jgi:ParB family chromosome partitioning protein
MKKKAMGRGLDAIFESNSGADSDGVSVLSLTDVVPNPGQPRKSFDANALAELTESVKKRGVIQPILVREAGDGFYVIIAGERRYRAAKNAGLTEIPAIIMDISEGDAAEISLIENIQRQDLNPMEEAAAYKSIMDDFGLTQEELSERIGKPRSSVANMLRLLELPPEIATYVAGGALSAGHAKALMSLKDKSHLTEVVSSVMKLNLSVRATETYVKRLNNETKTVVRDPVKVSYDRALSERMFASLGRKVRINSGKKRTVEITYTDNDDLESLIKKLCGDDIFDF